MSTWKIYATVKDLNEEAPYDIPKLVKDIQTALIELDLDPLNIDVEGIE